MPPLLPWPAERPDLSGAETRFDAPPSNCLLDLHGSLQSPDLVLFMAGNQFRALPDLLAAFQARQGPLRVFYATTPPGLLIDALASGRLVSGNFCLDLAPGVLWPDVFMAGAREHQRLCAAGWAVGAQTYARNHGCALLVRRGNPLKVQGVVDMLRPEVRVAISSPQREAASFASYASTLDAQGGPDLAARVLAKADTWLPRWVHHREIPQALADGLADVAPLYRHLALYLSAQMPDRFETIDLPAVGNPGDELAAAVLNEAAHPQQAQAWCRFLQGPEAAALWQAHGFDPVACQAG
jgi:hypothetical protein